MPIPGIRIRQARIEEHGIPALHFAKVFQQQQHCPAVSFYVILRPNETRVPAYLLLLLVTVHRLFPI